MNESPADEAPRRRVLVAEDNPVNQRVAVAMLAKIGFPADVAINGLEAVEALERTAYGAVLMDCQMPQMDGYAATAEIRRRELSGAHVPIIAMTARAMAGERERCLAAGMDDYLSKPVDLGKLEATLRRWMDTDAGSPKLSVAEDGGDTASAATFDAERVAALRRLPASGHPDMFAWLAGMFADDAGARMATVWQAVGRGDAENVSESLHTLKGSAATIGAARFAALCADLEAAMESTGSLPDHTALSRMDREIDLIRAELARQQARNRVSES